MAAITTTQQGSANAMSDVQATWTAGTLQAGLATFCTTLAATFPATPPGASGVALINNAFGSWLAILAAYAANMPLAASGQPTYAQMQQAAIAVAQMYAMAAQTFGPTISVPAVAALIAAYNTAF